MKQRGNTQRKPQGESIFYGGDSVGLKLGPKTVLTMSLLFIGAVVVLHFIDKLKFSS